MRGLILFSPNTRQVTESWALKGIENRYSILVSIPVRKHPPGHFTILYTVQGTLYNRLDKQIVIYPSLL